MKQSALPFIEQESQNGQNTGIDGSDNSISKAGVSDRNTLNELSASEWIPETVSVWIQKGLGKNHPDAQIEKQHPAPFSFTDVGRLIRFFTKRGQTVLDPFMGIGSTLKACAIDGRNGIGIELNPRYVALTKERLEKEVKSKQYSIKEQQIYQGDCRELLKTFSRDSVDFVVTSPPYWCILHKEDHKARQERKTRNLDVRYSNDQKDLGNIFEYQSFLDEIVAVFEMCSNNLKKGKYMAIVVGDFRDKGKYHMFHADLANRLEQGNLSLKGITILYQNHKRIFPYGYPTAFVPNLHHQYIMILQKSSSSIRG